MNKVTMHDGNVIDLVVQGEGPTILIPVIPIPLEGAHANEMRKWGVDPALGKSFIDGLSDQYRVVAFDYEGHVLSKAKPNTLTPENITKDFLAIADAIGADEFAYYRYSWLALSGLQLSTCWRRHKKYEKLGIWHRTWSLFLRDLHEMDEMQMDQVHLDASFVAAKKGGTKVGKTKVGKGSQVFCIEDANPHEINFAEKMVEEIRIPQKRGAPISKPKILVADKGYNSQVFRLYLKKKGIKSRIPIKKNQKDVVGNPRILKTLTNNDSK